ncbi:hypothetical protein Ancab_039146 [Ancistrocladus abbreviatus]
MSSPSDPPKRTIQNTNLVASQLTSDYKMNDADDFFAEVDAMIYESQAKSSNRAMVEADSNSDGYEPCLKDEWFIYDSDNEVDFEITSYLRGSGVNDGTNGRGAATGK